MPTKQVVLNYIDKLQKIQQVNRIDSVEWLEASKELHIMFKVMADKKYR